MHENALDVSQFFDAQNPSNIFLDFSDAFAFFMPYKKIHASRGWWDMHVHQV